LLLLFSTHASVLNQTPVEKKYQNEDFFRSLFSQLMLRDPSLGGEAKKNLSIINRSGERLLGLINDVLVMS
jgi:signal transduction histidine kinase